MTIDALITLIDSASPEDRDRLREALRVPCREDVPNDDEVHRIVEDEIDRSCLKESDVEDIARRVAEETFTEED